MSQVKDSDKKDDTYINQITSQIFKVEKFTTNNYLFVIAVINFIFDINVSSTMLNREMIIKHINK